MNTQTDVKNYNTLLPETDVLKKRSRIIKNNLEKTLNLKLKDDQVPIISICSSGGGFRSMISTIGFLCGLEKIGLLDSIMYLSTISGSSWAVIPWVLQGVNVRKFQNNLNKDLDNFYQLKKISDINLNKLKSIKNLIMQTRRALLDSKAAKKNAQQEFGFVDWYGVLLSNVLLSQFGSKRFKYKLNDLAFNVQDGNFPIPLFSAISQFDNYKYGFVEFTPFSVGSSYLNSYIKSKHFGKKFVNGNVEDNLSEEKLSFLIGALGSSFSGSLKDLFNRISILPIPKDIQKLAIKTENKISQYSWGNRKLTAAFVNNFTFGMNNSPIKNLEKLMLVDAGYVCNLAIEPLLNEKRKSNIIILLDNTKMMTSLTALKQVETIVKQKGSKFPAIDYKKAKSQTISVFRNEKDKQCPIVIYIRLRKDSSYMDDFNPRTSRFCSTTNFFYSKQESKILGGLIEHIVTKNKDLFFDLIRDVI